MEAFQLNKPNILDYYSQDFVIDTILKAAKDREAVGVFATLSYDKRPNIIQYKPDLLSMIKNGVTSIHLSVEHWTYPMHLTAENYDELRKGFDIIIDIDSKVSITESKTAAILICDLLERYGITNYGLKFSGRRGFHICIPWKMLPKEIDFKSMKTQYPRIPRIISDFIRHNIREGLIKEFLKNESTKKMLEGKEIFDIDPFQIVEVEKDWGSRHLFRAPLSLNEKTWLVSKPIDYQDLKSFQIMDAKPELIKNTKDFFKECKEGEADILVSDALDWYSINTKVEPEKKIIQKRVSTKKIYEENFPPCMKLILDGLKDGKKRSLFTIISFLRHMNWEWGEIESKLYEMNDKNSPKLPKQVVKSQLNWAMHQSREINPANCNADAFYKGLGICIPDATCKSGTENIIIKNPMNYPFIKLSKIKKKENLLKCYKCGKEFKEMKQLLNHKKKHN